MAANEIGKTKSKKKAFLTKRRGVIVISTLAVLVLVVNIVTASFSWFTPQQVQGAGMAYTEDAYLRSEQCTFSTYQGTKRSTAQSGHYIDEIEYGDSAISYLSVPAGQTRYFRTSIINSDTQYASDVSVYFDTIGQSGCNLTLAVTFPSNTVRTISSAQSNYYLVRNAYVKVHDSNDVDGPGLLQIDWFVRNNGSSAVTLKLGPHSTGGTNANMYLMYN